MTRDGLKRGAVLSLYCIIGELSESLHPICDPFWHSESDVARAEYLVSPIMP